jgi:hypothetical protein
MRMHTMSRATVRSLAAAYGGVLYDTREYGNDRVWQHIRHLIVMRPDLPMALRLDSRSPAVFLTT